MSRGLAPKYDGTCTHLSEDIFKKNLSEGKPSVIRFRKFEYIKKFGDYIYKDRDVDRIGFERKYNKFKQICINYDKKY